MKSDWTQSGEEVLTSLSGNNVARFVPSSEGPKLVINREEYALKESCWDIEMFHGIQNSILIFYWKGGVKLSVKIAPLSNLLYLHYRPEVETESRSASRSFHWSQVEAFLVRLYQCLKLKSRTIQPV